ncbi:hypothetical protein A9306_10000 [Moraxella atlantae]|uniref:Uncharacterized protein n=1 Tax=Faucicola atlantae TaxID=34059 RepID=A0A1B8QB39_9GAMM|nr:hypothetical protein A9306_10000 [Moraxella atlantae]
MEVKDEPLSAYNLTVDNDHTYFIAGNYKVEGVWVHNDCYVELPNGAQRIKDIQGQKAYLTKDHSGNDMILVQKASNRFETLDHKGIEIILPKQKNWESARNVALKELGDLGPNSKPLIGRLQVSDGYGNIIGRQSADGKKRWRLDYDEKKGMHINIEDFSKGKDEENAIKKVIPFEGNSGDFNRYLKHLNR